MVNVGGATQRRRVAWHPTHLLAEQGVGVRVVPHALDDAHTHVDARDAGWLRLRLPLALALVLLLLALLLLLLALLALGLALSRLAVRGSRRTGTGTC